MIALGLARVPPPVARCPAGHGGRASGAGGERWGCWASAMCGVCLRQEGWATPVWPQGAGSQEDFLSPPTHPSSHCSILSHPSHPSHPTPFLVLPCLIPSPVFYPFPSCPIPSHCILSLLFYSVPFHSLCFALSQPVLPHWSSPMPPNSPISWPSHPALPVLSCPVLSCPTLSSPQQQLCPCLCLRVTNLAQASCPDQSPMAICFSSIPAVFPLGARPTVPAMPQAGGGAGPGDSPSAVTAHTCFHTRTRSCGEDKEHGAQGRSPPGHPSSMNLPPRPFFYGSCPMHLPPPCT